MTQTQTASMQRVSCYLVKVAELSLDSSTMRFQGLLNTLFLVEVLLDNVRVKYRSRKCPGYLFPLIGDKYKYMCVIIIIVLIMTLFP